MSTCIYFAAFLFSLSHWRHYLAWHLLETYYFGSSLWNHPLLIRIYKPWCNSTSEWCGSDSQRTPKSSGNDQKTGRPYNDLLQHNNAQEKRIQELETALKIQNNSNRQDDRLKDKDIKDNPVSFRSWESTDTDLVNLGYTIQDKKQIRKGK